MEQQARIVLITEPLIVKHAILVIICLMEDVIKINVLVVMVTELLEEVVLVMDRQSVHHAILGITCQVEVAI